MTGRKHTTLCSTVWRTSTHSPTITPTPRPIAATPVLPKETPSISNSSWIYPNANIIERSGNTIKLQSGDSADAITEWYKTLIRQSGAQVKSFVQTKTNGVVLNKLVAAGNNKQTKIEISQKPGESVIISITGLE